MNVNTSRWAPCTITPVTEDPDDVDAYNNPSKIDGTPVPSRCFFLQDQRQETTGLATQTEERATVRFPPATDLEALYRVTTSGKDYEVFGEPWRANNSLRGTEDFVEATLVRTT